MHLGRVADRVRYFADSRRYMARRRRYGNPNYKGIHAGSENNRTLYFRNRRGGLLFLPYILSLFPSSDPFCLFLLLRSFVFLTLVCFHDGALYELKGGTAR